MVALLHTSFLAHCLSGASFRFTDVNNWCHSFHLPSSSSRYRLFYDFGRSCRSSFSCLSLKNENNQQILEEFSVLQAEIPWMSKDVWTTMGLYFFSMHIPLSFGGLSVVAGALHQPDLGPEMKALSLVVIQTLELFGALLLLQFTAKPDHTRFAFLNPEKLSKERNWLLAVVLGLLSLVLVIFVASLITDRLFGTKVINSPALKEILSSGIISEIACALVYCLVTPVLEEIVYRGFLLRSLGSTMKWHQAVIISSAAFSAAHLSGENFLQIFIIGAVLGCSYCWTGNLKTSIVIHSVYNAFTLLVTYLT